MDITTEAGVEMKVDTGFQEFEIVAYIGDFKVVGIAHFGVGQRASSRRASDYIRHFNDTRLTLSKVRIYGKGTQELLETAQFIVVNVDKIDFLYARDSDSPPRELPVPSADI